MECDCVGAERETPREDYVQRERHRAADEKEGRATRSDGPARRRFNADRRGRDSK